MSRIGTSEQRVAALTAELDRCAAECDGLRLQAKKLQATIDQLINLRRLKTR